MGYRARHSAPSPPVLRVLACARRAPGSAEGWGNDADAKRLVMTFLGRMGYEAIDAGSLADSRRVEPGSPIYVWPYAPAIPSGLSGEKAEDFYVSTPGEPFGADEARELIMSATRPQRIGGYPEDLPPTWVAIVTRWTEVANRSARRSAG